jgi:hypothetical protein
VKPWLLVLALAFAQAARADDCSCVDCKGPGTCDSAPSG